jgi:O-antigen biosynthesis protein WbqP
MKRIFDSPAALAALIVLAPPIMSVALGIKLTSAWPVLYWSNRVGRNNAVFKMPKFRTMHTDTPAVATHLLGDPDRYVTRIGRVLRKTSLDEPP